MDMELVNNMDKLEKLVSTRMLEYEEKLQKATSGVSPPHTNMSSLSRDFSDFKSFVWQTLSTMKSQIELLTLGLDRHETAMRRKVLLLHGITEKPNEKVLDVVHKVLTDQLKLSDVAPNHIQACHRLGSSPAKNRPVLVRFQHMEHRHLVWDSKTSLKGTGITISEFLTKSRHRAFTAARSHFGIKQCWTVEGRIIIILPDKSRRKIESLAELHQLISQFPSCPERVETTRGTSPVPGSSKTSSNAPKKTRRRI